jgi:hypothetical protein
VGTGGSIWGACELEKVLEAKIESLKLTTGGQVQWPIPVIPVTWEVEIEDCRPKLVLGGKSTRPYLKI